MTQQIEIKENNKNRIVALIVMAALVPAGLWLLWGLLFSGLSGFYGLKIVVTAIAVSLPVFAIVMIVKGMLSGEPALIINERGITDNAVQSGVGFIPWGDIVEFKEVSNFVKQKLLVFYVRNPIEYLSKINGVKNGLLTRYHEQFGTPIVINLFSFEYDHCELKRRIEAVFNNYRRQLES